MRARNIVRIKVSYCNLVVEFDNVLDACRFMDTLVEHVVKKESDKVSVRMERTIEKENEEDAVEV